MRTSGVVFVPACRTGNRNWTMGLATPRDTRLEKHKPRFRNTTFIPPCTPYFLQKLHEHRASGDQPIGTNNCRDCGELVWAIIVSHVTEEERAAASVRQHLPSPNCGFNWVFKGPVNWLSVVGDTMRETAWHAYDFHTKVSQVLRTEYGVELQYILFSLEPLFRRLPFGRTNMYFGLSRFK